LKLEEQKGGVLLASAGARTYNGGPGGRVTPTEADGILVLEYTFFCAVLELVVVADLTKATRQRRTFDTAAVLSVND